VLGKYLEAIAKGKTSEAIKKLMNLSPKIAIVIRNKKELQISVDDIVLGDIILVKPGEKIPVDGIIIEGYSSVDESIITGESIPVEKTINSNVIGGSINKHGTFKFKTTKVGKDTTLSHIIKLIEDAQTKKAPIQRYADKISSYFVPVVILISIFTFIIWYFIIGSNLSFALLTSVAVLVIACPCALGLATPTAIMVGSGLGAKYGILIKGGDSLETAHKLKYVLFDKTGTITNGKPIVTNIIEINAKENEILMIAASLEKKSEHSLAESIIKFAEDKNVKLKTISNFEALPGFGITGEINNEIYYFGNRKLIHSKKLPCENKREVIETLESEGKTVMLLANTKKILGIIAVADTIKLSSKDAIKSLNKLGIETYMITGDNLRTAKAIAKQAGINENNVFAEVLPKDKANHVKQLQAKGQKVAMIGDGINDSPALAQADIGIVMGSGTDIAMESGNIVLMQNNLTDIPKAIKLSKFTISKIKQNMFWALIYNVIGIPIAAGALYFAGITLSPIIAGSAMALSSVSVVSSSILLKYRKL
jgi:Cu+-exporting ATPase